VIWIIASSGLGTALRAKCTTLQSHTLPLHRALLSRMNRTRNAARYGLVAVNSLDGLLGAITRWKLAHMGASERAWGKFS